MKIGRIILSAALILVICFAWMAQFWRFADQNIEYEKYVEAADGYFEKALYQKAVNAYSSALAIKEDRAIWEKWIQSEKKAYEGSVISWKDYAGALNKMCAIIPEEIGYWEELMELYINKGDYSSARLLYGKSRKSGVKSEILDELGTQVVYSYSIQSHTYSQYFRSPEGYYTVFDDNYWGTLDPSGEWFVDCVYQYISPVDSKKVALYSSDYGNQIIDGNGIVQAIIEGDIIGTKAASNGMIPIHKDGQWVYYDYNVCQLAGTGFEDVSSFSDGGYAVVMKDDRWRLVNSNFDEISDTVFDDVKLFGNGAYAYQNRMIAAVDGNYGIYDDRGNSVSSFHAKDMDLYLGGLVAFQDDNGKWGFVDQKGEVTITPQYEKAKSFSSGMAAVFDGVYWGYIDETGKVVIDYQFLDADYFTQGGVSLVSTYEGLYYVVKLRFPNK